MKNLDKEFDKEFPHKNYLTIYDIKIFIRRREKALLKEIRKKIIGSPYYKKDCMYCDADMGIDPNVKVQLKKLDELEKEIEL